MSHINISNWDLVSSLLKKIENKTGIIVEEKYITDFLAEKYGIVFDTNHHLSLEPGECDSIFKSLLSDLGYGDKNVTLFSSFLKDYINTELRDVAITITKDFATYLKNKIGYVNKEIQFEDFIISESDKFGINGLVISLKTVENFINYYSSSVFNDTKL